MRNQCENFRESNLCDSKKRSGGRVLLSLIGSALALAAPCTASAAGSLVAPAGKAVSPPVSSPLPESEIAALQKKGVLDADDAKEIRRERPVEDLLQSRELLVKQWKSEEEKWKAEVDKAQLVLKASQTGDEKTRREAEVALSARNQKLSEATDNLQKAIGNLKATTDAPREELKSRVPTGGSAGLRFGPAWHIIAGQNISSFDPSQPTISFGLERQGNRSRLRLDVSKSLTSTSIDKDPRSSEFGAAILQPQFSNISIAAYAEIVPFRPIVACDNDDCSRQDAIHSRFTHNLYVNGAAAQVSFKVGPDRQVGVTPVSISIGYKFRVEGKMPDSVTFGGTNTLSVALYVGNTTRLLGGDITKDQRQDLLNTRNSAFTGIEFGGEVQVGNVRFDPKVSYLWTTDDPLVAGLTSLRVGINASFILPWSSVKSGDPKPGDPKPGDPKPGEPKPEDPKPGDQKPGDQKPGEPKPGEPKPGEPKPA